MMHRGEVMMRSSDRTHTPWGTYIRDKDGMVTKKEETEEIGN